MSHADPRHDTDPAPPRKGNGHGDKPEDRFPCAQHAAELAEGRTLMGEMRGMLATQGHRIDDLRGDVAGLEEDMHDQIAAVSSVVLESRETQRIVRDLASAIKVGNVAPVRPPLVSLDWDRDEPTLHGQEPDTDRAHAWAERARDTAAALDQEREERRRTEAELGRQAVQLAELQGKLAERDRQSERVRADTRFAVATRTRIIIAALTGGGVVAAIGAAMQLFASCSGG